MTTRNFLGITPHAARRMAQRGIRSDDLELGMLIGTEVKDGYLVREKDYQAYERDMKQLLDHAKRLVGKRFVIEDGHVKTAYHADRRKERRLLRSAADRSLVA